MIPEPRLKYMNVSKMYIKKIVTFSYLIKLLIINLIT